MLDAISANRDLLVTTITWLKLLLVGIIFYDLFIMYLGKPDGNIRLNWKSTPYQELRASLKYIIVVPLTFVFLFILESTPKGMEFTPLLSRAATIFILFGWLFILVVPKRYAVTDSGVLIKGTFYRWDYIKTVEPQKGLSQVQIVKKNPLMPPSIMLCQDADEVHKAITEAMEAHNKGVRIPQTPITVARPVSRKKGKKPVKAVKMPRRSHSSRIKRTVRKARKQDIDHTAGEKDTTRDRTDEKEEGTTDDNDEQ